MRNLSVDNTALTNRKKFTFLNSNVASGVTTITVESIVGFGVNQVLVIGEIGNEKTEIVRTHATTTPTGSTITLAAATTFNHSQGDKVYIVDYNQFEISWSSDDGLVSKEVLETKDIQVDQIESYYTDTTKTSGTYYIRFKNSITSAFSSYSDGIPYGDYTRDTVAKIIEYALKRNKLETYTKFVDYDFCIEEVNSCLQYIKGKKKKWTHLQEFDYNLGQTTRGQYSVALPSNVWKKSHKAILDIRIGERISLRYADKKEWNDKMFNVFRTEVVSAGSDDIVVTNASGLDDDGIVMIEGKLIEYDSIDGNTIKDVSDDDVTTGANVWQGSYQEGTTRYYTVYDEKLFFWPMCSVSRPTMNIVVDFWTEAPEIDSDGDRIDMYRYDMIKHWLTWAIRMQLKNDGVRDFRDGDYVQFREMLNDAIKGDIHGQKMKTEPALNRITYGSLRDI